MAAGPWDAEYAPTGRFDDLLAILARADHERLWDALPRKGLLGRRFAFPAGAAFGRAVAALLEAAGPRRALAVHELVLPFVAGKPGFPFREEDENLALARRLLERAGTRTALLCIVSHPPVLGELFYLNIELVRHALLALSRLRPEGRARFLVAVDPYALDTQTSLREGLYAGFMGHYHLGLDRQAHLRRGLDAFLLENASWASAGTRLCSLLRGGGELGMVLAGGVPTTARVLYAAREFLWALRRERPGVPPASVLTRLLERSGGFAAFWRSSSVSGALRRSAWRMLEAWVMDSLTRASDGTRPLEETDRGELCEGARAALESCAEAMGFLGPEARARVALFEEEFRRQTPYRERFFRLLAGRVAASGTGLLLLPLTHGSAQDPSPRLGAPLLLRSAAARSLLVLREEAGAPRERELDAAALAREFVRSDFH